MNDLRIQQWAKSIGHNTTEVIYRIFNSVTIKEQGYNSSLSVLKLSKSYSPERLKNACELALISIHTPRYKHLKAILSNNQDLLYSKEKSVQNRSILKTQQQGYVRGAEYYGGVPNDK